MAQLRKLLEDYTTRIAGVDPATWTDFEYHNEASSNTIISTKIAIPAGVVTAYCIGIPLLQIFMRNRSAFNVKYILFAHNMILSLLSFYLLLFMGSTVLSYDRTYHDIYCALTKSDQRGTLNWLYYINLLVKYYELTDTVFLVIKKKPVTFLHGYHHPATLVFAYIVIMESPGMEWTVLILNLFVHTIMYFYYAMSAIKIRMPGKQIITICQIVQFVLDLVFVWHNVYDITLGSHSCIANVMSGITATLILGSYLLLFLDFFKNAYCSKPMKIGDKNGGDKIKVIKGGIKGKKGDKKGIKQNKQRKRSVDAAQKKHKNGKNVTEKTENKKNQ